MIANNKLEFVDFTAKEYAEVLKSTNTVQELSEAIKKIPSHLNYLEDIIAIGTGRPYIVNKIWDEKDVCFICCCLVNGLLVWKTLV